MILILKDGNDIAKNYGFGSALDTLCKGLDGLHIPYTHNESDSFDVIISNDFFNGSKGIELKNKTGKPLIASIHLSHPDMQEEQDLLKNCDGIVVYSKAHYSFVKEHYNPSVPMQIVQLGIDTSKWKNLNKKRQDFLFFVGRTKAEGKNFISILWKSLTEGIKLKVAGDLDNAKIGNVDCKYMNQPELMEAYNSAQLHILPSTFEPFGLVTLEAMACGCPVAVSIKSGVAELLNDSVAILFDPTKDFSLTELMAKAKKFNPTELSNFAYQFNHKNHAQKFIEAVNSILNKSEKTIRDIEKKRQADLFMIFGEIERGDYDYFGQDAVMGRDVVDIGAYMGETAVHFSNNGAKLVYALEPLDTFDRIETNAKANGCDNIIACRIALGAKNKIVRVKNVLNDGSTRFLENSDEDGVPIEVCTLKTITERFNIEHGFLKLDCEGAEINLLYTNVEILHKYDYIVMELHEEIYAGLGLLIKEHLKKSGFNVWHEIRPNTNAMLYAKMDN
jgi:FkbM family methyltransferase